MISKNLTSAKRGRKPFGSAPMTTAERKRRSREQLRAAGGKDFFMRVEGIHLEYVEALAQSGNISTAQALRQLMEPSLDRYVGIMRRSERMRANGASDEVIAAFINSHLFPTLPPIDETEASP